MTHDEAAVQLREAIQGNEESLVAMDSVIAERGWTLKLRGALVCFSLLAKYPNELVDFEHLGDGKALFSDNL